MRSVRLRTAVRLASLLLLSLVISAPGVAQAKGGGGHVLPPSASPHGYTLKQMTRKAALFTTSGNNLAYYPDTPFQILYAATFSGQSDGNGLLVNGSNSFTVKAGTKFWVPVWNATDSAPIVGEFPTTHAAAGPYFFDQSQVGGRDFEVIVDGKATRIGRAYLAGPVTTPPLLDGDPRGTHIITLSAFLSPLSPGNHTVTIRGGVFGAQIAPVYGYTFIRQDLTYTVHVVPRRHKK